MVYSPGIIRQMVVPMPSGMVSRSLPPPCPPAVPSRQEVPTQDGRRYPSQDGRRCPRRPQEVSREVSGGVPGGLRRSQEVFREAPGGPRRCPGRLQEVSREAQEGPRRCPGKLRRVLGGLFDSPEGPWEPLLTVRRVPGRPLLAVLRVLRRPLLAVLTVLRVLRRPLLTSFNSFEGPREAS